MRENDIRVPDLSGEAIPTYLNGSLDNNNVLDIYNMSDGCVHISDKDFGGEVRLIERGKIHTFHTL